MPLIQKSFSTAKIIYLGLNQKNVELQDFKPFSIRINNKYCNGSQFNKFNKHFVEPGQLVTFAFIAGFKTSMQCLVQASTPSKLLGLIHISSYFEKIHPHNWLLPYDIEVAIKSIDSTDKGLLYKVTTRFYQSQKLTLINDNEYLDKTRSFKNNYEQTYRQPISAEINLGDCIAESKVRLSTSLGYALLSGDLNPIHLTHQTARLFGLKRALIHGMYNCHWALLSLQNVKSKQIEKVKFDFNKPCFLPSEVSLRQYEESNIYGLFDANDIEQRFLKITLN